MSATLVIVSALPIKEAVSNWKFNIWKWVFKKHRPLPVPLNLLQKFA